MADVSKITLPNNGGTFDIKDAYAMQYPYLRAIDSKTYTDVIATENDNRGAGFFFLKIRGDTYDTLWHVRVHIQATVPSNELYHTDTLFDLWGCANTYSAYLCENHIRATGYRPIYSNSLFCVSAAGYDNGCGSWIGVNLTSSKDPTVAAQKRTIVVELLDYSNCSAELQDNLITPDNIPNRASHTNWYSSTNTSYSNFDAYTQGLRQSGDSNTTNIFSLYRSYGNYIADSAVYRYQMLFEVDENTLTPLNNNNNVKADTHTMLTDVEFDPFKKIYYYNSTTAVAAGNAIGAGGLYYAALVDVRYSLNTASTLTAHEPFYLVVTPTSNGKCKLASETPWAQTLPTTADGNWYVLIGRTSSTYQVMLYTEHPVYMYDGGAVRRVLPPMSVVDNLNVALSLSIGRKDDTTVGYKSTAEGYENTASAMYSHAEGWNTSATGFESHAEGYGTTASGSASHAEGYRTSATSDSHAEGNYTTASGSASHVEGYRTSATYPYQHVSGKCNADGDYAEIVGNGNYDPAYARLTKSNARTLDWNGNEELAGDLTINKDTNPISVGQMLLTPSAAISIPAEGTTISCNLYGITPSHVLVAWRFSESPENNPPCNLTWTTYKNSFSIQNTNGTTSETIQPVFALPNALAATT